MSTLEHKVAVVTGATSGKPVLLGGLALVALVVASGGLLHLLTRPGDWRRA